VHGKDGRHRRRHLVSLVRLVLACGEESPGWAQVSSLGSWFLVRARFMRSIRPIPCAAQGEGWCGLESAIAVEQPATLILCPSNQSHGAAGLPCPNHRCCIFLCVLALPLIIPWKARVNTDPSSRLPMPDSEAKVEAFPILSRGMSRILQ
jgi:hypothetical protein